MHNTRHHSATFTTDEIIELRSLVNAEKKRYEDGFYQMNARVELTKLEALLEKLRDSHQNPTYVKLPV